MTFVNNPSTIPGMSEVLRTSLKRVTLKGHKDPLPILIPGQRPELFQCPKHSRPLQHLALTAPFLNVQTHFFPAPEFAQPPPRESITQIHQERSSFVSASPQQPSRSLSFSG